MLWRWRCFQMMACVLLLCWGGIIGVCLPWGMAACDNMEQLVRSQETEFAALQALQAKYPNLEIYQLEVGKNYDMVSGLLPDNMDALTFLAQLQRIGRKSDVNLLEMKPGGVEQSGKFCVQTIDVVATGPYFALLEWVKELQQGHRFCNICRFELQQDEGMLICHLSLQIYSFSAG